MVLPGLVIIMAIADLETCEKVLSTAYNLYLFLLKADNIPGNCEEFREVLFSFCHQLSEVVIGV